MIGAKVNVVENNLPRFSSRFRNNVSSAMRNGMLNFVRVADPSTPRDTGFLVTNKTHTWPSAGFLGGLRGAITYNAPYAGYVHDGTRYMEAQPWAQDAIDLIHDDYVEEIRQATEEAAS